MDRQPDFQECLNLLEKARVSLTKLASSGSVLSDEMRRTLLRSVESIGMVSGTLCQGEGPDIGKSAAATLESSELLQETEDLLLSGRNIILVVDDDFELRSSLCSDLKRDYRVYDAPDGVRGLALAREVSPDIIVSDIGMPEMDGINMCEAIKSSQETSHIPVILLTAKQDKQTIIHGFESGADDYIVKPYDIAVLNARIRNILDERQRLREKILTSSLSLPSNLSFANRLDREFMSRILKVAEKELSNSEFQIDGFCRQLAMSRTALYSKLKALTGKSPNDFMRFLRLNKAKELLSCGMYNVTEVSEMVGFSDPKYFSISFKKQFDVSPSKVQAL